MCSSTCVCPFPTSPPLHFLLSFCIPCPLYPCGYQGQCLQSIFFLLLFSTGLDRLSLGSNAAASLHPCPSPHHVPMLLNLCCMQAPEHNHRDHGLRGRQAVGFKADSITYVLAIGLWSMMKVVLHLNCVLHTLPQGYDEDSVKNGSSRRCCAEIY